METYQLVKSYQNRFRAAGIDNSRRVTEELLAHVFNCKPLEVHTDIVILKALPKEKEALLNTIEALAQRIENGEPLQYVVGNTEFWGLKFKCDPRALIPRPETELLVEEMLCSKVWEHKPATIVDVGTGTGCIAITLASQRSDATIKAVDISPHALELARENARYYGFEDKIKWYEDSLLERFAPNTCHAVVSNLPYITSEDWNCLSPSVRDFEPKTALEGGPTGLELIYDLATQACTVLVPKGQLFLEFGYDQGGAVYQLLDELGYTNICIKCDLAGHERIAIASNST